MYYSYCHINIWAIGFLGNKGWFPGDSINIYYLPFKLKLIVMKEDIFEQMTDKEIREYLDGDEADMILSSLEYQEMTFLDCCLPA